MFLYRVLYFSCFWKIQVFFSQLWLQLILHQDLFKRNILARAARIWTEQLTLSLGLDDSGKNIYIRIKSFELVNIYYNGTYTEWKYTWNEVLIIQK